MQELFKLRQELFESMQEHQRHLHGLAHLVGIEEEGF